MPSYPSTRWSVVVAAGAGGERERLALAWLCERYWECLCAHVRRRGFPIDDAEDLTQEFMLSVIAGGLIDRADPARGRFRTFLLACLDHQLAHARARRTAAKRGGGRDLSGSVDDVVEAAVDPVRQFDLDWARHVVARAKDQVRSSEPAVRWQLLEGFLIANGDAPQYAAIGRTLGMSEGAVKVAVHRLRERFRAAVRAEVAETLSEADPALIDAEIGHLLAALAAAP